MKNSTLLAFLDNKLIFASEKKWLYPLIDLHQFLKEQKIDDPHLLVEDKVVGRASALILVYLGIRQVKANILSKLGREILEKFNIRFRYDQLVDEISCATETMLKDESDPETAFHLIMARINNQ
jgi:hypothetical protein